MRKLILAAAAVSIMLGTPALATNCNDGTYSYSSGSGTCSYHGGESRNQWNSYNNSWNNYNNRWGRY